MAFIAKVENLPSIRRAAFNEGPKPPKPPIITPPSPPYNPTCTPEEIVWSETGDYFTKYNVGGKPKYVRGRFICKKTTKNKTYFDRFLSNNTGKKGIAEHNLPINQVERNRRPIGGRKVPDVGFRSVRNKNYKVDEDNS